VAEEITGSRFGFIGEIGPDGLLHDIAISNPGWELCTLYDRKGRRRPPNNFHIHGIYGKVLSEGKGYFINEPASHPDSVGLPSGHPPLTAFLGVPLIRDGAVIGMIAMGNREGGYTGIQLELLNTLAPAIVEAFQRKRAEDALRKANHELAAINKELEGFSYSVSHDLRAPLRSMIGFSDMLFQSYSDKLDEKGKKFLTYVANGAQKMDQIVDSLLRLSRIGRQDLHREDVDLSKIAQSVATVLCGVQPRCRDAITIKQGIRGYVDPRLVEVALSNLLSNALKFTSKTVGPHVEFGSVEQEGKTVYYVSDNGAGFDQRFADGLFLPFHRLHSDQEFSGTGIGLAIVEKVISRHGGKIWAEGKTNEGATFFFTLL
jgi:signal transduction histidine kinase